MTEEKLELSQAYLFSPLIFQAGTASLRFIKLNKIDIYNLSKYVRWF